jgi:hypothetical protein
VVLRLRARPLFEIDIAPRSEAAFGIAEAGHQIEFEAHFFGVCAGLKQLSKFGVVIDWAHGLHKTRPVGGGEEFALAVLLHHLRQRYKFVVNAFSLQPLFHAMCGEVKKVLTFNIFNVGLRANPFKGLENWPIGTEGSQGTVIAHVVQIAVERCWESRVLRLWFGRGRGRNDAVAFGRKLRLFEQRSNQQTN